MFGYSVTKWRTVHWALIKFAPREISDIIRYIPFLHHLAADARSSETTSLSSVIGAKIITPYKLIYRRGGCAMFTEAFIQHVKEKIHFPQVNYLFFFAQTISFGLKMHLSVGEATLAWLYCSGSGLQRVIAYMLQQQLFELQLLPQLQWKLIRSLALNSLYYCFSVLCEVWLHGTVKPGLAAL